METSSMLFIGSLVFATAFGVVGFGAVFEKAVNRRRSQLVVDRAGGSGVVSRLAGEGVAPLKGVARIVLQLGPVSAFAEGFAGEMQHQGYKADAVSLLSAFLLLWLCLGLAAFAVSGSLVGALAVVACTVFGLNAWKGKRRDSRKAELREEIPEALQSMKACFQTGYSLKQTVHEVSTSTKGPLSSLFSEVEGVLETNGGAGRALSVMKRPGSESELVFLATALDIQHRTGGSMGRILEATRQSVVDELELKRNLKTQTAQAKLSAQIVTAMPFVLIGLFSLLSPGFLDPFFSSPLGFALLALALGMQALGISLVRRLLKVGTL